MSTCVQTSGISYADVVKKSVRGYPRISSPRSCGAQSRTPSPVKDSKLHSSFLTGNTTNHITLQNDGDFQNLAYFWQLDEFCEELNKDSQKEQHSETNSCTKCIESSEEEEKLSKCIVLNSPNKQTDKESNASYEIYNLKTNVEQKKGSLPFDSKAFDDHSENKEGITFVKTSKISDNCEIAETVNINTLHIDTDCDTIELRTNNDAKKGESSGYQANEDEHETEYDDGDDETSEEEENVQEVDREEEEEEEACVNEGDENFKIGTSQSNSETEDSGESDYDHEEPIPIIPPRLQRQNATALGASSQETRSFPASKIHTDISHYYEDVDDFQLFEDFECYTSTGKPDSMSTSYCFPSKGAKDITAVLSFWEVDFQVGDQMIPRMGSWEQNGISPQKDTDTAGYARYLNYKKLFLKWVACNKSMEQWHENYWGDSLLKIINRKNKVSKIRCCNCC